ncbi:MAG: protein-glutamate O-methyltransferase CheR [Deltaproteobacteria bacterium]|nr:protein-glutamate O-methyltransferase CheR [Deltaproteobacteria bacterium]
MRELDSILELLCNRYGLIARNDWAANVPHALQSMRRARGISAAEIIELAFTDDIVQRELASYLTVDESFFFRHTEHFDILVEYLTRRLSEQSSSERIVIWSAGCADGQEPYSIAMALRERFLKGSLSRISIIATDMNTRSIDKARLGVYSDWSFRGMDEQRRKRFFKLKSDKEFALGDEIINMVTFHCMSIQEHAALLPPSSVEVIFFRNVGIYLHAEAQAEIYRRFHSALRKEGLLLLAPSDVMPNRDLFVWDSMASTSVYTPTEEQPQAPRFPGDEYSRPPFERKSETRISQMGRDQQAERALSLADSGNAEDALAAADALIANQPHGKLGYLIRGQIHLAVDSFEDATNDLRRAVFIDPDDSVIRFWYAYSLQKSGASRRSLIQVNNLVSRLSDMQQQTRLKGGQTTVGELLSAARQLKELLT